MYLIPGNNGRIEVSNITEYGFTLDWEKADGYECLVDDISYYIYITSDNVNKSSIDNESYFEGEPSAYNSDFTVSGLEPDTLYYYTVFVYDYRGTKDQYEFGSIRTLKSSQPYPINSNNSKEAAKSVEINASTYDKFHFDGDVDYFYIQGFDNKIYEIIPSNTHIKIEPLNMQMAIYNISLMYIPASGREFFRVESDSWRVRQDFRYSFKVNEVNLNYLEPGASWIEGDTTTNNIQYYSVDVEPNKQYRYYIDAPLDYSIFGINQDDHDFSTKWLPNVNFDEPDEIINVATNDRIILAIYPLNLDKENNRAYRIKIEEIEENKIVRKI